MCAPFSSWVEVESELPPTAIIGTQTMEKAEG